MPVTILEKTVLFILAFAFGLAIGLAIFTRLWNVTNTPHINKDGRICQDHTEIPIPPSESDFMHDPECPIRAPLIAKTMSRNRPIADDDTGDVTVAASGTRAVIDGSNITIIEYGPDFIL